MSTLGAALGWSRLLDTYDDIEISSTPDPLGTHSVRSPVYRIYFAEVDQQSATHQYTVFVQPHDRRSAVGVGEHR